MKRIILIVTVLFSFLANAQLSSLVIRGDTLFNVDPTTGVYTQLTKSVPTMVGQSGKVIGTNGSAYTWVTPFDGTWSSLSGKPSISGTNTGDQDLSGYSLTSHTHTYASLTSKPTTLSGYGITDAVANTITVNGHALNSNVTVSTTDLSLNNVTNESKATMFNNAAFTGTFTAAAGSIGNAALANAAVANLSGTNTGDNSVNSNYSGLVSNATHTGDATGSTALTVVKINGTSLAGLGTGILKNTTGTGVPSIAVAGDFPTLNQNTSGTAADLSAVLSYAKGGISASAATSATTGTMTVNMTSSVVTITPTGACTFNASGGVAGQILTFSITTSGVSAFVLTFGTNFRKTGTLSTGTTSARFFTVTFICLDGTTWSEIARTAVQS